ncbi:MurR/RpiR family transcriptional regulator [Pandoraea sp.]|uniref:MurR/RpiR family transcriptional regulator n=1 Tax=Pandoraea sp. TaxID=1883445 RepID=UPI0035B30C66
MESALPDSHEPASGGEMKSSIRASLASGMGSFTPSEQKVAKALLDKYPSLGLSSISNVANYVGVSDPTVFRFVVKLGFSGYAAFQQALLEEIDTAMNTPLARISAFHSQAHDKDHSANTLRQLATATEDTADKLDPIEFRHAVDLLSSENGRIFCGGGRYTAFLASAIAYMMGYVRPNVRQIDPSVSRAGEALVDMTPNDVLLIFDFRRYQRSVVEYARAAKRLGVRIVLVTDEWTSPIGTFADVTLKCHAQPFSVIDTKVPALAVCEALVVALTNRDPERARRRVTQMEWIRTVGETYAADAGHDMPLSPESGVDSPVADSNQNFI